MKFSLWTVIFFVFVVFLFRGAGGTTEDTTGKTLEIALKKINQGKELTEDGVSLLTKISEGVTAPAARDLKGDSRPPTSINGKEQ